MTIKDLAAMTGYAVGTVSRVLNNHPNVSEKARTAILRAVEESGFELNVNAKQLKQQHTNTILVVVKGIGNGLFGEMVEHIQARVAQTCYPLVVDYIDENSNEVLRAIQLCREKKPRGIVFLGGNILNFQASFGKIDVPAVLITGDASTVPFENLSSVSIDDRQAARRAVEVLMKLGHERIAVIGGDRGVSDISRLRFEGCWQAFQAYGADFDPELDYRAVRFSCQDGYDATQSLLDTGRQYTAIFAVADVMAIGAIRALADRGLRVPEDVSVMGMDGLPLGRFLVPQLATVSQNAKEMACRGMEILLGAIEQDAAPCHESVAFDVCPRQSVRSVK